MPSAADSALFISAPFLQNTLTGTICSSRPAAGSSDQCHSLGPHSNRWNWMQPFLLIMEPTRPTFQMTLGGLSTESQWQCLPLDKPQSKGSGTCVHHCLEETGVN